MGRRTGEGVLFLPEIAPDGIEQDAQPPGRTAAGEENAPAVLQRAQDGFLDFSRPTMIYRREDSTAAWWWGGYGLLLAAATATLCIGCFIRFQKNGRFLTGC